MNLFREAVVKEVKPSAIRKRTFYITVNDSLGDIKLVATKNYELGSKVLIKRKNAIDWIWSIVQEVK